MEFLIGICKKYDKNLKNPVFLSSFLKFTNIQSSFKNLGLFRGFNIFKRLQMKFFIQKSGCGCSSASQADSCGCSAASEATDSCPNCSKYGIAVSDVTIKSQLKKEYLETLADRSGFSFCKNPQCDTVYYKD
ncbi:MAG: zf CopZ protein, partial [Campylobacterota bacterium]|nr:zf CopZ protein [Campylobacterota bacterium]